MSKYKCNWPDCDVEVGASKWGCRVHWNLLPFSLKVKITETLCVKGVRAAPTHHYALAVEAADAWITESIANTDRPGTVREVRARVVSALKIYATKPQAAQDILKKTWGDSEQLRDRLRELGMPRGTVLSCMGFFPVCLKIRDGLFVYADNMPALIITLLEMDQEV